MRTIFKKKLGLRLSVFEQISASAGSFLFYILAARIMGPADFGFFALHIVPAQIVHSIAVQWILLPITTTPGTRPPPQLLNAVFKRLLILIGASGPFAVIYYEIAGVGGKVIVFGLLVMAIFIALTLFDLCRYLTIRLDKAALQFTSNILRWLTSFVVLGCSAFLTISSPLFAIGALVGGILVSLFFSTVHLFKEIRFDLRNEALESDSHRQADSSALLSLGLANAAFSLISSSALARSSLAAFGAIQSFRSLVNWAPLILQYLETHFASTLARDGKTVFMNAKWVSVFLAAFLIGEAVILTFGEWILIATLGADFVPFAWLLAVMYALVLVQSYTRTVGIEVRLSGAVLAIWIQALCLVFGGCLIAIWMLFTKTGISTNAIILIMVATAVMQAFAMFWGLQRHHAQSGPY